MKSVLIIGAGSAGKMVAQELVFKKNIAKKYRLLGFLDDDRTKDSVLIEPGSSVIPVLGGIQEAQAIIEKNQIDEVIIAIPSAGKDVIQRIVSVLSKSQATVKIVPGIFEIIEGSVQFSQIRQIQPQDLLGREEVGFDIETLSRYYQDKTILVTGAGGSIGCEIFLQLLKLPIKEAIAFGHGENSIHQLITTAGSDSRFNYCIGDVRDMDKLRFEMGRYRPDIVFHAAAHKHLPLMEDYPDEAVKTNVIGSYNTAVASIEAGVKQFMMISTDKAVNPTSVMGATKRIAEKICLSLNAVQNTTRFSLTRFGNVLGSRGSVIPIFKAQLDKGGPITITHPDITRYFMSIPEAARLVIKSGTISEGRIYVLDMGRPVKILDLAKNMIRLYGYSEEDIPIVFTGLRKGEKMVEELVYSKKTLLSSPFTKLFISTEDSGLLGTEELETLISNFSRAAGTFDDNEIRKLIKRYVPEFTGAANA